MYLYLSLIGELFCSIHATLSEQIIGRQSVYPRLVPCLVLAGEFFVREAEETRSGNDKKWKEWTYTN